MVARRLLILMLVMLVIASLSSVFLAPPGPRDGREPEPTRTTEKADGNKGAAAGTGGLVTVRLDASAPKPRTVRLETGDQLSLRVEARRPAQVEIKRLGLLEDVVPPAPARFEILADYAGDFEVRLLPARREIGRIVVREPDET